jgi:hypothetical protein
MVEVRRVDPRDTEWEIPSPAYRVYFFDRDARESSEFQLEGALDVDEVLRWVEQEARDRATR